MDGADPTRLRFDDSNRDYRNENNCEQVQFLRFDRADGSGSGSRRSNGRSAATNAVPIAPR